MEKYTSGNAPPVLKIESSSETFTQANIVYLVIGTSQVMGTLTPGFANKHFVTELPVNF